jgi:hypothetical protein
MSVSPRSLEQLQVPLISSRADVGDRAEQSRAWWTLYELEVFVKLGELDPSARRQGHEGASRFQLPGRQTAQTPPIVGDATETDFAKLVVDDADTGSACLRITSTIPRAPEARRRPIERACRLQVFTISRYSRSISHPHGSRIDLCCASWRSSSLYPVHATKRTSGPGMALLQHRHA